MSSLDLPADKSQARRVVWETLRAIAKKLYVPGGGFSRLATEITNNMYAKKKARKATGRAKAA